MKLIQQELIISTTGKKLIEVTTQINEGISTQAVKQGLCNLFLVHTSASLILCENDDVDVLRDVEDFMSRLVPENDLRYRHTAEGIDDMPAHIRTILTQNSLSIPFAENKLLLGTWQGVFLWEHRNAAHSRRMIMTIFGEIAANRYS